jgi:hypothetical protein
MAKAKVTVVAKVEKKKIPDVKKLKLKLWELCKQIIRKTYLKEDGGWDCFTCGKHIDIPFKAHTGHFIPSASCGAYLRYDLRNLRVQDYYCNINLGGNGATYYKNLVEEKGKKYVDQIFKDKNISIKADWVWFEAKIEEYTEILKSL